MSSLTFDFSDEHYLVTGASSGLGRQITVELVNAGATVLAVARGKKKLAELREEHPNNIMIAPVDVGDAINLEKAIHDFTKNYGKLNGAVHAAGIYQLTPLRSFEEETAQQIMQTVFWGGVNVLRLVTKQKYGVIPTSTVMISSISSLSHDRGIFAYSAAKAALDSFVGSAAKEICRNSHRVNSILPGWLKTPLTDNVMSLVDGEQIRSAELLGTGVPEDVSGMVLFLLSSRAKWITGSNIPVDGGYLA